MIPKLENVIKIYTNEFDKNLDFAYDELVESFFNWFNTGDYNEFGMRFTQLSYLMQSVVIRKQFTDIKKKLINMHYMIVVFKLFK